jgi:SAM-dependent methyltransferase
MAMSVKRKMLMGVNQVLSMAGVELIRKDKEFQDYIPLKKTLADAENAGMPLGDYIDLRFNVPGTTQKTIDNMADLGVFSGKVDRVCEIGPGSGRYLAKVVELCKPSRYEIYETSKDWREWLAQKYGVILQNTDGASLSSTPSQSLDLVHTHKVLYGNPIITIGRYLFEMARVVKDGGHVVFDLVTEDCLTDDLLEKWISSGVDHACSMTSKQYAIDFFARRGFRYIGGFIVPMEPGVTEYFVFKK